MHNKRIGRDDLLKIEVSQPRSDASCSTNSCSGLAPLLLLHGALTLVVTHQAAAVATEESEVNAVTVVTVATVTVSVADPLVDAPHLLDVDVIILHARMIVETATTIVEIVIVTAHEAPKIGNCVFSALMVSTANDICSDRDSKDDRGRERDRDEERENGTNGEDRKGIIALRGKSLRS